MSEDKEKPSKPQWFTIREAADYLQVGEPTIYRWMKEGRMTFRKVGDSTRFLQPDLDALVKVHRSEKDIKQVKSVCPYCYSERIVLGKAQSTGLVSFVPENTKFLTFQTGTIKTSASMCRRCGGVVWFADTEKLSKLVKEDKTESED